jgi:4-hydroxy 2-oxovalerate aldolase
MKAVQVTDSSLRDGSHALHHHMTTEMVRRVARALDDAGVPIIEVGHGDGLDGGSIQTGPSSVSEMDLIAEAVSVCRRARVAVMVLAGIGTRPHIREAADRGAQILRIATLCTEVDLATEYLHLARELGLESVGFLMLTHIRPPEFLAEQARWLEAHGADSVYLADSAGAMLPDDVRARVAAVKKAVSIDVGFHAHNNFGSAIGNCIAAMEAGVDLLDGSLRGLGAGAGNAPTELIATVLDRLGANPGLDLFRLMDAAEFIMVPFMPFQPIPDRESITLGYAGVYSTFLLHTKHAAERYGLDPRDVLLELGNRQALVGQEDWALDIAADLARAREGRGTEVKA